MSDNFDYVIVGAGSAGCVLANRLTANPKISVLLLEAGGKDTYPWIHIPVGYYKTMHNPKTDWCFKTEPDESINGRSINYVPGNANTYPSYYDPLGRFVYLNLSKRIY